MATELAKAYVQIVPTTKDISGNLKSIFGGSEATAATQKAGGNIGSVLVKGATTAMKAGAAGLITAGAAIGGIVAKSISNYSNYEQLVGGVETLFDASSDVIMGYAKDAYVTAGLSANQYMETITGFSASLIQSLGGDTEKAAEVGNRAIIDMSDNANKMGTAMESIQNAYQGFAKQNYTMLDNLKLGYGGTKEEMARLISDASKMTEEMEALGVSVDADDMSFANIVNSISVVQKHLGLTGTTADEAAGTIAGSAGQIKAAWENLLTGMADPSQDMDVLIESFVNSFTGVANNLVPRITAAIPRVVSGLAEMLQIIAREIPGLVEQLLPALIEGIKLLIQQIVVILPGLLDVVLSALPMLISGIVEIVQGIAVALPQIISTLLNALPVIIPLLLDAAVQIVLSLAEQLPTIILMIVNMVPTLIEMISQALIKNVPILVQGAVDLVLALAKALPEILNVLFPVLYGLTPVVLDTIIQLFKAEFPILLEGIKELVLALAEAFPGMLASWWDAVKGAVLGVVDVFRTHFPRAFEFVKSAITNILSKFTELKTKLSTIFNSIKTMATTIFSNIKNAITNPIETAKTRIKTIVDTIKGFFSGMNLSFPNIKLPHFKISPSGWSISDLMKGTIPKLSIDWYAKAMDEPYMFTRPTVIGNRGFGEAGNEIVYGRDALMRDIREASGNNATIEAKLDRMIELLDELTERDVVLDSRAIVGQLARPMDRALGQMSVNKARYV